MDNLNAEKLQRLGIMVISSMSFFLTLPLCLALMSVFAYQMKAKMAPTTLQVRLCLHTQVGIVYFERDTVVVMHITNFTAYKNTLCDAEMLYEANSRD